jgi:hypothetical protein
VSSKCFQLYYTCSDRLLAVVLPLALSIFFPSYCDVFQALSYFTSTLRCKSLEKLNETFIPVKVGFKISVNPAWTLAWILSFIFD